MVNKEGVPHVRVAVVGAGFAGLAAGAALERAGVEYTVFERADDLGGTWRDNRYPGCQCDVPSHLYSLSYALNPEWSSTYPLQAEIWDYMRRSAARFGVLPHIRFGHDVREACWDDAARRWRVDATAGRWTADVLVAGNGPLSEPALPALPGLERFTGTVFHSAAWDHGHDLTGERVGVVGTGSSAVQFVPRIQPKVGRLVLFQRTPAWVLPHRDRPIRAWERRLYRTLPLAQRVVRWGVYWSRELLVLSLCRDPRRTRVIRRLAVAHLERQVADPELRRKLTPAYLPGCKRLLLSNDFYPALTRDNVEVVTDPIAGIGPRSVTTADGTAHDVDTLVLATGFRVTDNPMMERIRGRDGRSLAETWREGGAQAYLGTTVAGFPNLFLLAGPNTGIGHTSLVFMIESQMAYVLGALRALERQGLSAVEPRREAQDDFNREVQRRMGRTVWTTGGCASWYLDARGRNTTLWPDFTWKYRLRTRRFEPRDHHLTPG
jgi:cation diffusion facilitator CzcD-associated flavoprotein CzcO